MSGITHSTVVVIADDGTSPVGSDEWNAAHTVADGSFAAAKTAFAATDKLLGRATAGAGNGEEIALTSAGRALIDDAAASDQRTTLGLGTAATHATTDYASAGAIGAGFFGDGSDGAITLQQTTGAPAWASKAGVGAAIVFTLTRDVYATTFDMDDSAGNYSVKTAGFRIFASTSLIIDAGVVVHNDGNAASADTAGTNATTGSIASATGAGSIGATNTTATQATAVAPSGATSQVSATAHGGTGGLATGGGTGGGVAGGNASHALQGGSTSNFWQALINVSTTFSVFRGGGGGTGGNATGGTTAKGGGGGAGGSTVAIYAKLLSNAGIIRAQGGAGGNGTAGNGTGSGGGGGGGGGVIVLVYGAGSTTGTLTVTGGTGGAPTGTGATGGTGVSGLTYTLVLS